jgi:hypothetical protein
MEPELTCLKSPACGFAKNSLFRILECDTVSFGRQVEKLPGYVLLTSGKNSGVSTLMTDKHVLAIH